MHFLKDHIIFLFKKGKSGLSIASRDMLNRKRSHIFTWVLLQNSIRHKKEECAGGRDFNIFTKVSRQFLSLMENISQDIYFNMDYFVLLGPVVSLYSIVLVL